MEIGEARFHTLFPCIFPNGSGGGDDGNVQKLRLIAQFPGDLHAVHPRQLDIHEDQFRQSGFRQFDGIVAIGGNIDLVMMHLQHILQDRDIVFVVLNDKDAFPGNGSFVNG